MDSSNRINQVAMTPTVSRQTPCNDFGQVLARTAARVAQTGAGFIGGLAVGGPVTSAAISKIAQAATAVRPVGGGTIGTTAQTSTGGAASAEGSAGVPSGGSEWDLLEAQQLARSDDRRFNVAYLDLQNQMQRESREFNAVSNIMKVRHDSAKAAINNIR